MLKRSKMFRKLIAIIAVSCMVLPTVLHNSSIIANTQELEVESNEIVNKENLENGQDETAGNPDNTQDEPIDGTGSVEDEVIPEDGVIKEEPEGENNQNPGIDNTVSEEPSALTNSISRSVGQTFYVATDGVDVAYTVLTEDAVLNIGTVKVGTASQSDGNGIRNRATPTDKTLTIPSTVVNGGITYTVTELQWACFASIDIEHINLPNSLQKLGPSALNGINAHTIIIPEGVTHIDDFCLANLPNLRVLKLPSTLETMGSTVLGNSLKKQPQLSIYYPYKNTITKSSAGNKSNNPFYGLIAPIDAYSSGAKNPTLIITDNAEQYNKLLTDATTLFHGSGTNCITYEMQLEFYDRDGSPISVDKEVIKLYYQDILWEKDIDETWTFNYTSASDFSNGVNKVNDLPTIPNTETLGYKANYWGMNEMGFVTINAEKKIEVTTTQNGNNQGFVTIAYLTSPKMFAVEDKLVITETVAASKDYDGKSALSISFNRNIGDYLSTEYNNGLSFYISLREKNSSTNNRSPVLLSNPSDIYLMNVVDSGEYTLQYSLKYKKLSPYAAWLSPVKDISIDIKQATININPQVDNDITWSNQTELPEIKATEGDTPGTYTWDAEQIPQLGTNTYSYTFVPDNLVGERYVDKTNTPPKQEKNYTEDSKTGMISITYKDQSSSGGSTGGSGGSSSDKEEEKEDEKDNSGNLTVDIEKDTPSDVPVSKEDIKDAVLSEEDIKELMSGTDVNIKVIITRIPEETEEIVTNALEGRSEGAYFDISIFKKVGNQPEVKVNSLNRTMRFVIDVPEELYATEGIARVFEVMKIHGGQVSYLPDLDQNENTVTIETDQFSTFVLCYTDSSTNVPKPNIPNTSNPTNTAALISIAVIAFIIIVLSAIQLREQRRH